MSDKKTAYLWVWDTASKASGIPVGRLKSAARGAALTSRAREGLCNFLSNQGWSTPEIGRFIKRHHTAVIHALRKGVPTEGMAYIVFAALTAENNRREEDAAQSQSNPPAKEDRPKAGPTIYRAIFHESPPKHYEIMPAQGGKLLMARRPAGGGGLDAVFGEMEPGNGGAVYFRVVATPRWLGGVAIAMCSYEDWAVAAGIMSQSESGEDLERPELAA